jgi:hypothetical protein
MDEIAAKRAKERAFWQDIAEGRRSTFVTPAGILPTKHESELRYQERQLARQRLSEIDRQDRMAQRNGTGT